MSSDQQLFLFDMDGVILDSRSNMEYAWKGVCEKHGLDIPFERYFSLIGIPFQDILSKLGIANETKAIEKRFMQLSLEKLDNAEFYEGVEFVCNWLIDEGHKIGIITSKDVVRTNVVLAKLDVEFSIIQTPEKRFRGKPAPDHLLYAMAVMNISPVYTLFVGDMDVDYEAAKNAGVRYLHANWGYGNSDKYTHKSIDSFFELKRFIENKVI